jgi:hypothetical protein
MMPRTLLSLLAVLQWVHHALSLSLSRNRVVSTREREERERESDGWWRRELCSLSSLYYSECTVHPRTLSLQRESSHSTRERERERERERKSDRRLMWWHKLYSLSSLYYSEWRERERESDGWWRRTLLSLLAVQWVHQRTLSLERERVVSTREREW